MNYLITAAGKGSRFLKKGIKPPKPLIKVFGNELLLWSLNSFNFKKNDKIFIVTYKKHQVKSRLEKKIKLTYIGIEVFWLELNEILNGQLLTAMRAISHFSIKGPILIHNCDTYYQFDIDELNNLIEDDLFGIIPCFKASGDNWSFVKHSKVDENLAIEVKEKNRISDNCSVGTYFFKSSYSLQSIFKEYRENVKRKLEEHFIAPIYQFAIEKNLKVKILKAKNVKSFGTPEELLENFDVSFNELLGENGANGNNFKTLIVDIDQTICTKESYEDYSKARPIIKVCNALRKAHEEGAYIILFTSRNLRSFRGSIGLINKYTAPILIQWLFENNIPYDEIYYGKPWGPDVSYIDDKNLTIEQLIRNYSI